MNSRQPTQSHQGSGMQGVGDSQGGGSQSMSGAPMIAPQQVPAHLMGLMTNPALAAAAAASPLFPPAAMLSNPGAFLTMPEAFVNANNNGHHGGQQSQQQQQQQQNNSSMSRLSAAGMGNFNPGGDNRQQQQVQHSQHQQQPASSAPGTALDNVGMPGFASQNAASVQQHVQVIPPNMSHNKKGGGVGSSACSVIDDHLARRTTDLSPEERARQNRDRNREHARSTRLRKKAYVQKLKELVEGLHAERTEEVRQRRVAIQHLAEMQNVRRGVVRTFLRGHSNFETDERKWDTILEDSFWFKQPVTPYRSFRRTEIEQDCRISRGIEGMIADSASISVMVEGIGSRSTRWMQIKREEFFFLEESKRGPARMPRSIVRQDSRLNHAVSSLSSSSGSSSGSASEEADKQRKQGKEDMLYSSSDKPKADGAGQAEDAKKVSSSSGSSSDGHRKQQAAASKDFHDYHAQPLPDPKLGDSGSSSPSEDSPEESNSSANGDGKRMCTDSSSGDDSAAAIAAPRASKRRKTGHGSDGDQDASRSSSLPPNIAKTGGITTNVLPAAAAGEAAVAGGPLAPAMPLPPFAGVGKRVGAGAGGTGAQGPPGAGMETVSIVRSAGENSVNGGPNIVTADVETSSSNSSQLPQIRAYYHINEDDMILMEDVLMCPFIFRSQDAVVCGALAECVMPGMFRAHFSARNKLLSVEMVYDAMGFMQQLERASGSERTAQIIPGSLEMALSPSSTEARVITLAEPPFLIVNVNEVWTRMTKYTQMEVEGKELLSLLEGERTLPDAGDRPCKPQHKYEEVAKGLCACSTNVHYDKDTREFVNFVCSYPLTNANDEITHLLHICKELPALSDSLTDT